MKPTVLYPTPPFKQLGDFSSLREAGFRGEKAYFAGRGEIFLKDPFWKPLPEVVQHNTASSRIRASSSFWRLFALMYPE